MMDDSDLAKIDVKVSSLWRTLEIVGGVIVLALAVVALADPSFVVSTLVVVIAAGLVIGGLFRIGVGVFAVVLPSPLRALNTAGGIVAFVLGTAALLDVGAAVGVLIVILALALLLVGAVEIGVGLERHPPTWLRASIVLIGVLTIILSALVIVDSAIGEGILAAILAVALLLLGVRNIVHGVTGHHRVAVPMEPSVVAA